MNHFKGCVDVFDTTFFIILHLYHLFKILTLVLYFYRYGKMIENEYLY
jgi:hypothetical protein